MHANTLATLALALWVPLGITAFLVLRPPVAAAAVLLGGALLLPERVAFDFPLVPPLGKGLIAVLSALLGALFAAPRQLAAARLGSGPERVLVVLMLGGLATGVTNGDVVHQGPLAIEPLGLYGGLSLALQDLLYYGVPFVIGRALFVRYRDLRFLLMFLAAAGLVYAVPIAYELRMAPVLHKTVYGFHQHQFVQTLRFGGYRPMVFMPHGLALSLFVLTAALAAVGVARARLTLFGLNANLAAVVLSGLLVACKSLGAMLYGAVLLPIAALVPPRLQVGAAALVAVLVIAAPLVRMELPEAAQALPDLFRPLSERRADSLASRLESEDALLERADERPWLGWGPGRERVYDQETGSDGAVDGYWVLRLAQRGIVGLAASFALLLWPVFTAAHRFRALRSRRERRLVAALALIVAISSADLIPNGFLLPSQVFLAGALAGLVTALTRRHPTREAGLPGGQLAVPPMTPDP